MASCGDEVSRRDARYANGLDVIGKRVGLTQSQRKPRSNARIVTVSADVSMAPETESQSPAVTDLIK